MNQQIVNYVLAAADDDNVCASQALAGAGDLTINGAAAAAGVATLDIQRRVLISSAGDDHLLTFTVYGTRQDKGPISEAVTGTNAGTAYTTQDFKTVTRVAVDGAVATTVKVGTNGVGSSPWQMVDFSLPVFLVSLFAQVAGAAVNYTVQYTFNDANGILQAWPPAAVVPTPLDHGIMVGQTVNSQGFIDNPCWGWRVLINSGLGSVKATGTQQGLP